LRPLRSIRVLNTPALAIAVLALGSPAVAPADTTMGVSDLENADVALAYTISGPSPNYTVWASGKRDGDPSYYASAAGFLTQVRIYHFNASPVTVKILVFRRDINNDMKVVAAPATMALPAAGAPGVITSQAIGAPPAILAGDRIGMTAITGTGLHAQVEPSTSPVSATGTYPSSAPSLEPAEGSVYSFVSGSGVTTGPLIQGIVSSSSSPTPAHPTVPLASVPRRKVNVGSSGHAAPYVSCYGLVDCAGKMQLLGRQGSVPGAIPLASRAAGAPVYGSTSYAFSAGKGGPVKVKLTKAALKQLAKKGKLTAYLLMEEQLSGTTVRSETRITLKGKRKKK
jgi:hypothetical protein